jgi:hypothetical protein
LKKFHGFHCVDESELFNTISIQLYIKSILVFVFIRKNTQFIYEACPESKDKSHVGRWGNFLCLLWQHSRRPWSFTCEPCSFGSGRTGLVWVRRVWYGSADPKSRQMRDAFRHTISLNESFQKCLRPQFMKLWQKN